MSQIYIEYHFKVDPLQPGTEILIAELGHIGFESFVETEDGVKAYIQKTDWNESILESIHILSSNEFTVHFTFKEIEQVNWNEEWEKNFSPIEVDGKCLVRAPFHSKKESEFEIIIEPKMSFGTGHHETTFMMLQFMLENDFKDKKVLDMGCGTAVLAILAEKKGASKIDAIDIDEWCYLNSKENIKENNCNSINVFQGEVSLISNKEYDVILANINRNILLQDIKFYCASLKEKGELYLSGFYLSDLPVIEECCYELGLTLIEKKTNNDWVSTKFVF